MTAPGPDLLLIGHGSRDPAAAGEFAALRDLVAARLPGRRVGGGFLELADPPIDRAVDDLVAAGATDVMAVPYVLFGAGHLKDDGPAVLGRARSSATSSTAGWTPRSRPSRNVTPGWRRRARPRTAGPSSLRWPAPNNT